MKSKNKIYLFEQKFANYLGMKHAYSFWKGRVALSAILYALGVKKNDEILLPGYTCVVVPNSIIFQKAKPVYVDINPYNLGIDPKKIEKKITSKTKVIIIQHTLGIPAQIEQIIEIAKKHNLKIIEDSAQCLGSLYKNQKTSHFSDAAFFSTQWSKPFTTGIGGIAVTNDEKINKKLIEFQKKCLRPGFFEIIKLFVENVAYTQCLKPQYYWGFMALYRFLTKINIVTGSSKPRELFNKKPYDYEKIMSGMQAKIGLKKLKNIDIINEHRQKISKIYIKGLKHFQSLWFEQNKHIYLLRFPLLVQNKKEVLLEAKKHKIEIGDWFLSPIHPNQKNLEKVGYSWGDCPVAEKICKHIINLPTHSMVNEKMANKIINFIQKVAKPYYINNNLNI